MDQCREDEYHKKESNGFDGMKKEKKKGEKRELQKEWREKENPKKKKMGGL